MVELTAQQQLVICILCMMHCKLFVTGRTTAAGKSQCDLIKQQQQLLQSYHQAQQQVNFSSLAGQAPSRHSAQRGSSSLGVPLYMHHVTHRSVAAPALSRTAAAFCDLTQKLQTCVAAPFALSQGHSIHSELRVRYLKHSLIQWDRQDSFNLLVVCRRHCAARLAWRVLPMQHRGAWLMSSS